MTALLEIENLEASYGWTKVLHGVSFQVEQGGVTAILGANGAGKTTSLPRHLWDDQDLRRDTL